MITIPADPNEVTWKKEGREVKHHSNTAPKGCCASTAFMFCKYSSVKPARGASGEEEGEGEEA
jgi:hypothetical protein